VKRIVGGALALVLVASLSACVPFPHAVDTSEPTDENVSADLQPFYSQVLTWTNCENSLQCATATAPLDWANPADESIELALVRSKATGSNRLGSLLLNPGGPGGSGYDYVAQSANGGVTEAVQEQYDIVGFDPRGVGKSTQVTCGDDPTVMDNFLYGDPADDSDSVEGSDEWLEEGIAATADFGAICEASTGALFSHVDTETTARDLDLLRAVLGDEKLNFLGYSYGTYLGATYAELYPENTGRIVLDGAVDPAVTKSESAMIDATGFENALRAYMASCLDSSDCVFDGTVDDAMADVRTLMDSLDESPLRADDGRELDSNPFTTAMMFPLYDKENWPYLDQLFTATLDGDPSVAWALADAYNDRDSETGEYTTNLFAVYFAVTCLDDASSASFDEVRTQEAAISEAAPVFGPEFGYGGLGCKGWPVTGTRVAGPIHATGSGDILVVGTTNDPATPYAQAVALADELDNGYLVTYNGEGHTAYNHSNSCVDDAVDDYFLTGAVPATDPDC
jgi:pimeloyl-ACP methyl ester carboxylesterase